MRARSAAVPGGRRATSCSRTAAKQLSACAPCYLKSHSQGEYVFDRSWADAYERAGGRYYPKLQIAVPFTPVPGRRLLVRPGPDAEANEALLAEAAVQLVERNNLSGLHITFASEGEWERLGEPAASSSAPTSSSTGAMPATAPSTTSWPRSRRASARRCARSAPRRSQTGLTIEWVRGREITEAHWDAFFAFYMDTGSRKWGRPYLNRKAFSLIGAATGESCLLVMAMRGKRAIAGSLHMIGGDCLYGRYWGAIEHHPCLHFELCYYQAIEFAIAHKHRARGGGRPGRAQAGARLPADQDLFGALHRRSVPAPRDRRLSRARARLRGCGERGARRIRAVPQGRARSGLTPRCVREEAAETQRQLLHADEIQHPAGKQSQQQRGGDQPVAALGAARGK